MFQIIWFNGAFDVMDRNFREYPDRIMEFAIALAVLNDRLTRDPVHEGESRWGNVRITFTGPLTAYFEVDLAARIARIVQIRVAPPKS